MSGMEYDPHDQPQPARVWSPWTVEHRAVFLLAIVYFVIVTFVLPPVGEFPVCDDGVFAATARDIAETGMPRVSNLPSMTLLTHAAWGAVFLRVLGDSWWSLHMSVMVMAWVGGLSLYRLGLQLRRTPAECALACGCYVFCPLVYADSYTFMTDVTATSLMLASLASMPAVVSGSGKMSLALAGLLAASCFLTRQTAAIPAIFFGVWLAWEWLRQRRSWSDLVIYALPGAVLIGSYFIWLHTINGVPDGYGKIPMNYEVFGNLKGLISKILGLLLETALLTGPWVAALATGVRWPRLDRWQQRSLIGLGCVYVFGTVYYSDELHAFRGYSLFDAGLGYPPTHVGIYQAMSSPVLVGTLTVFQVAHLASAAILFAACSAYVLLHVRSEIRSWSADPRGVLQFVIVAASLSYFALLQVIELVFDRYTIPLVAFSIVGLWSMAREPLEFRGQAIGWGLLLLTGVFNIVGTADMLQTRRVFWQTVSRLVDNGVPASELDGGWAYQMAYLYEPALRQRPPAGPLFLSGLPPGTFNGLVPLPRYCLAYGEWTGWTVQERMPYSTCFRDCELLLLYRPASASD